MRREPPALPSPVIWVLAAVAPALAGWALTLLRGWLSQAAVVLLLTLVVVAIAGLGDRIGGAIAAVSAAVWFDFFFTQPLHSFTISSRDDLELAGLFVLVGLAVSEVALWGHRQRAAAGLRDAYIHGMLAASGSTEEGTEGIAGRINAVLGTDKVRYVEGEHGDEVAVLERDGSVTIDGRDVGAVDHGLPTDRFVVIPVIRDGVQIGHFLVSSGSKLLHPRLDQLQVAVLLADQAARLPQASTPEGVDGASR